MDRTLPPIHPGKILLEDFMKPLGLSQYRLAHDISVTPIRISQIVHGQRSITVDTAMRLVRYFGTSAAVWLRAFPCSHALSTPTPVPVMQTVSSTDQKIYHAVQFSSSLGSKPNENRSADDVEWFLYLIRFEAMGKLVDIVFKFNVIQLLI